MYTEEEVTKIAKMNDIARRNVFNYLLTVGIRSLSDDDRAETIQKVKHFKDFTKDNDPYGEHDFGSFEVGYYTKVFFKIDYMNQELTEGCSPLSPECRRVVTVMLASEY